MNTELSKNLLLTIDFKRSGLFKRELKPYLIGLLPVEIKWRDGRKEITLISDGVEIDFFPEIKKTMGIELAKSTMAHFLKDKWTKELIAKMTGDFERISRTKILPAKDKTKGFNKIKIIPIEKWRKATEKQKSRA